jgi:tetratricopeptide (TPR) repeat protein
MRICRSRRARPAGTLLITSALLTLGGPQLVAAQDHRMHREEATPARHEGLGSLSFPTSGAPEAQPDFERGVLLLHSFEYEQAAAAFRAAQATDPDFAMAYWGEAMTHNHPVWDEQDREAALAALAGYAPTPSERAARAPTPRERMYLEAVDVLYGAGPKAQRDTLYFRAMEALAEAYPADDEARALHALAILGLSRGDRVVPSYMRAGAIALDLFQRNRAHPGAAHYVIHSFDDPTHAPLGLAAADAYADIAPAAGHAQHMTTHIFLAIGLWDRVVESNIRADAVVDAGRAGRGLEPTDCGHYNEWLAYGYQQQGRRAEAEALVLGCLREGAAQPDRAWGAEYMRALQVASLETLDGQIPDAELPRSPGVGEPGPGLAMVQHWTGGFVAARRGQTAEARRRLLAFEAQLGGADDVGADVRPYVPVWHGTLRSVVAAAEGDLTRAVEAAHEAAEIEAALPEDFGPPIALKPARELEADLLLRAGRADEALSAYRLALARTPRRAPALAGFAAAAQAAGQEALARSAREELAAITVREGGSR